jgi:hypothetical protein
MTLNEHAEYLFASFGGYEGAVKLWGLEDLQQMVQYRGPTIFLTTQLTVLPVEITTGSPPVTKIENVISPVPNNSWEEYGWLPGTPVEILSRDFSTVVEAELGLIPYTDRWCWGVSKAQQAWVASKPHGSRWWGRIQTSTGIKILQIIVNLVEPIVVPPTPPKITEANEVIFRLGNYPRIRVKLGETVLIKTAGDYVYWKPLRTETLTYEALVNSPNYDLVGKDLTAADALLTAAGLTRILNTLTYQKSGAYKLVVELTVSSGKVVAAAEDAFIPLNLSEITGVESWRLKQSYAGKATFESKTKGSTLGWRPTTKAQISAVIS